jgi:hypothetical protein
LTEPAGDGAGYKRRIAKEPVMSHIPSSAMPHAKPHEAEPHDATPPAPPPPPPPAPAKPGASLPWAALATGGVIAIGGAVAAVLLLRGRTEADEHGAGRRRSAKKGHGKGRAGKQHKVRSSEDAEG